MFFYLLICALFAFGIAFALCSVIVAVALVLVVGAVVMGLAMPSRTVRGQLRSVVLNTREAIAQVNALRPS